MNITQKAPGSSTAPTETSDIMALGSALSDPLSGKPIDPGHSVPFVVVPQGYELKNIEDLYPRPARARGTTILLEQESFIEFVKERQAPNLLATARMYGRPPIARTADTGAVSVQPPRFAAVFNDTMAGMPGWGDDSALWECPLSPEWIRWIGNSHKQMPQADFARFIEDNLPDIAEPAAADMLDLSRTLEAKSEAKFASSVRLDNGANQLKFEETIEGAARGGQLQIPQVFALGIPVLLGGQGYRVEARFRYRLAGSKLTLWYEIIRPHKIVEDVFKDLRTAITEGTGMKVFVGAPETYGALQVR